MALKIGKWDAEEVKCCPICFGEGKFGLTTQVFPSEDMVTVYVCESCDVMYHNPRMTEKSMQEYYSSGLYVEYRKPNNFGERSRALRRISILLHFNLKQPTRALDIGCAEGHLLERIKDWSKDVETVGYDIYKNPNAIREVITDRDKIKGKFDFISCVHVLEHMPNPLESLDWMYSLLEDEGTLFLELPTLKKIILDHPITFSKEAVPILMERIGMKHYTMITSKDFSAILIIGRKVNDES